MLTEGLRGDWGPLPIAGVRGNKFLKCSAAGIECRDRYKSEVEKGRMISSPGLSAETVRSFLQAPSFVRSAEPSLKKTTPTDELSIIIIVIKLTVSP